MKALRRKLKSRRGASILLALLFFLLCMMVGASVLAAAASNAGRIKSNKEEQQKYLTLSSAVNLLIDELESVEYVGVYTYTKTPQPAVTDAEGHVITPAYDEHTYIQTNGTLRLRSNPTTTWGLKEVLPLYNDLDKIFSDNFSVPAEIEGDVYNYTELYRDSNPPTKGPYILELAAVPTAGNDYGALTGDKVRMEVTLRTDGSIKLIATLWERIETADPAGGPPSVTWEKSDYTMEALLRPDPVDDWAEKLLVLPSVPDDGHKEAGGGNKYRTDPIQWKLEYIFKKEADPSATPAPT